MFDSKDCSEFVDFLMHRLVLSPSEEPSAGPWVGAGNTMGSIALRIGLLDLDQIDRIISKQAGDPRLFGEIAVATKLLTQEQVDLLLTLQHFHRCLDSSAALLIEGRVSFAALLGLMSEFFDGREKQEVPG